MATAPTPSPLSFVVPCLPIIACPPGQNTFSTAKTLTLFTLKNRKHVPSISQGTQTRTRLKALTKSIRIASSQPRRQFGLRHKRTLPYDQPSPLGAGHSDGSQLIVVHPLVYRVQVPSLTRLLLQRMVPCTNYQLYKVRAIVVTMTFSWNRKVISRPIGLLSYRRIARQKNRKSYKTYLQVPQQDSVQIVTLIVRRTEPSKSQLSVLRQQDQEHRTTVTDKSVRELAPIQAFRNNVRGTNFVSVVNSYSFLPGKSPLDVPIIKHIVLAIKSILVTSVVRSNLLVDVRNRFVTFTNIVDITQERTGQQVQETFYAVLWTAGLLLRGSPFGRLRRHRVITQCTPLLGFVFRGRTNVYVARSRNVVRIRIFVRISLLPQTPPPLKTQFFTLVLERNFGLLAQGLDHSKDSCYGGLLVSAL